MSWMDILKAKKINMDGLRKIIKHFLDTYDPKQFALSSLIELVVPVYLKYNKHQGAPLSSERMRIPIEKRITSIVARTIRNMGYSPAGVGDKGLTRTKVARDDLQLGQKTKGSFYVKDGEQFYSVLDSNKENRRKKDELYSREKRWNK